MGITITKDNLFRPMRSRMETRADITDQAARDFIRAESEQRDANTARLRQARLENEAKCAAARPTVSPRHAKVAAHRGARSVI
ncbi:hypothetical protein J2S34_002198 [Nitrobacter winogradskyi]|uniref:Uncharacterized protein n=1 Tax=Nitrobacter winogradskyi TaxID=913 RepID=A0ACC6AIT0_NITWI|nr:hypothetical protein [Nitrobacter winogradskyi]